MKFSPLYIIGLLVAAMCGFSACDDSVTTLGSSLITDNTEVVIDSTFTITGQSVENTDIPSRTTTQILGSLTAKEYGSFSSDFVTQFMPALSLDTTGTKAADIDSIKMLMFYTAGDFTGDSIVPMGLKVYPLTRQLPSPIYSDFDPKDYYDESNCWTPSTQIYTGNALYNDSLDAIGYRTVSVKLPLDFALKFYNEYITNPQTFATPEAFTQFFPGVYVKNTFGSGRVINFSQTRINLYYKQHSTYTKDGETRDTVYNRASAYMAVTPEVISNNIINMNLSQSLKQQVEGGDALLVAPASYDVKMTFPAKEMVDRFKRDGGELSVINTLTMSIPVETITNGYSINPPTDVLLVLSKDKDSFFANNKIADNETSFLATYNELTKTYDFTGMRPYIISLLTKETITADDYTFTLTPVNVVYETTSSSYYDSGTSYVTQIIPYVSGPAMCKLNLQNAKIKFTYSKQSIKNL
ncbi:MAG: DUF4270 domain-containing protein [Bacteroides sp.]|nr:DUF4270 domain-containing protein [Bacteroides sp.]